MPSKEQLFIVKSKGREIQIKCLGMDQNCRNATFNGIDYNVKEFPAMIVEDSEGQSRTVSHKGCANFEEGGICGLSAGKKCNAGVTFPDVLALDRLGVGETIGLILE